MLNKAEYPTWKVKIMIFLEGIDCDYLDKIHDEPFVTRKLIPAIMIDEITEPGHYVLRNKSEWSKEEKAEALKDANIRNILHNAIDFIMSNEMITCKTFTETWDALEIQC